jgi:hypothetical protein
VVAKALFGGPQWIPEGYTQDQAHRDVVSYIKTGAFTHKRWTDMDLRAITSRDLLAGVRRGMSENEKRRAVLVAWLGGLKAPRGIRGVVALKRHFVDALSPEKHPGQIQKVFEAFDRTADKSLGAGKRTFELLRIGNTSRLVQAGSKLENVVIAAKRRFEEADHLKHSLEAQKMSINAYENTIKAQQVRDANANSNRRAAIENARMRGMEQATAGQREKLMNLRNKGLLNERGFSQFFMGQQKEMLKTVERLRAEGANPETIAIIERRIKEIFSIASKARGEEGQKLQNAAMHDELSKITHDPEVLKALMTAAVTNNQVNLIVARVDPDRMRLLYREQQEIKVRAAYQSAKMGTFTPEQLEEQLRIIQVQASQSFFVPHGDGEIDVKCEPPLDVHKESLKTGIPGHQAQEVLNAWGISIDKVYQVVNRENAAKVASLTGDIIKTAVLGYTIGGTWGAGIGGGLAAARIGYQWWKGGRR